MRSSLNLLGRCLAFAAVQAGAVTGVLAQPGSPARRYREAHEHQIVAELSMLLAMPNIARDSAAIRRNADTLVAMLQRRGLAPRLLETPGSPPVVYGEWLVPGATRTLVFYAHYDGQPVDSAKWTGTHPFRPQWRTGAIDAGGQLVAAPAPGSRIDPQWRLYARSASDDKGGVIAILTAIDALRAARQKPTSNIRIFFEGEEEAGSPHLRALLDRHRALLIGADAWIMVDGPEHQSGRRQVVFGVRGDVNVDVTVYGPTRPLHSGHYGNWAPNPAMRLAQLLATLKDSAGRVSIAGWYDDVEPLGAVELQALAETPAIDSSLAAGLGLAKPDGAGRSLAALINEPSLNVNGIASAGVGAMAANVIPTTATAVLDLRVVRGVRHERQIERLVAHVRAQGYLVLDRAPTMAERQANARIATITVRPGGYDAERTSMELPIARAVVAAVSRAAGSGGVVRAPTLGGSLPLIIFREALGAVTIGVPIANHDNNQHAENENIRVGALWDGIETLASIMIMPAAMSGRPERR